MPRRRSSSSSSSKFSVAAVSPRSPLPSTTLLRGGARSLSRLLLAASATEGDGSDKGKRRRGEKLIG